MNTEQFASRHIGPRDSQIQEMLSFLNLDSLDELTKKTLPPSLLMQKPLNMPEGLSEKAFLEKAAATAQKNQVFKTYIGLGYYDTLTPGVILRNILENPTWYTAYTPYQAEISQGRMEALLNFQTLVMELCGLDIANASLLDEGTAVAEAMHMAHALTKKKNASRILVDEDIFPQSLEVLRTRAEPLGIKVEVCNLKNTKFTDDDFAMVVQYPCASGKIENIETLLGSAKKAGVMNIVATDLLALCLLKPPGEMGADIVVGTSQRFGVPMGFGGPHAAFMATREEFKRSLPGRIIGVSKDAEDRPALRLALQTREQHIRREKATSNICTSQVLLAVMASMYAVYHGPEGLKNIARHVHGLTVTLAKSLKAMGFEILHEQYFDTLRIRTPKAKQIFEDGLKKNINLLLIGSDTLGISLDEAKTLQDVQELLKVFGANAPTLTAADTSSVIPKDVVRQTEFLKENVFHNYRSETEMLRYITRLQTKDLSLAHAMIPLGSCTMKLNATSEMMPVTLPGFCKLHPFIPRNQAVGYLEMIHELEKWLCEITGFAGVSLQPNAGSQGEYAGLLVIRKFHQSRNQGHRNVCLIPSSAHGTNPASAVMAGMQVVVVACDNDGNVDLKDLQAKAEQHKANLAALMITYPSTHGVFEEAFGDICGIIHRNGGQVYMDGANLNALVGVFQPGAMGADVAHMYLHKTFCIPHGGGGPGVGPIGVGAHLKEFLPKHSLVPECGPKDGISAVSAAPWGSAAILPISWGYIAMMGRDGLKKATQVAMLNANYMAKRLKDDYPIVYKNREGWVAHECIIDVRGFKETAGVTVVDIAKRLIDFGFHAPTMSWPVAGTLMIEPTESESKEEIDRFIEAMLTIREEIREIENGKMSKDDNVLKNAPHTLTRLVSSNWTHPYSREKAAYPQQWVHQHKFWASVSRVDDAFGDKNLVCSCAPLESY